MDPIMFFVLMSTLLCWDEIGKGFRLFLSSVYFLLAAVFALVRVYGLVV